MRMMFSWIVLILLCIAFYICEYWIWALVLIIYRFLYQVSSILFWVVVVTTGLGLVYYAIGGLCALGSLVIRISQKIHHTKKGGRYRVIGIADILFFTLDLIIIITYITQGRYGDDAVLTLLAMITMIVFGITLVSQSRRIAYEDGAPLTKKERLQAKLDKIEEKERLGK